MELFVEMACNTLFGAGKDGFINAPDPHRVFTVRACGPVVKVCCEPQLVVNELFIVNEVVMENE